MMREVHRKKEKQSLRKRSIDYKARHKELGQERIAVNIAAHEV